MSDEEAGQKCASGYAVFLIIGLFLGGALISTTDVTTETRTVTEVKWLNSTGHETGVERYDAYFRADSWKQQCSEGYRFNGTETTPACTLEISGYAVSIEDDYMFGSIDPLYNRSELRIDEHDYVSTEELCDRGGCEVTVEVPLDSCSPNFSKGDVLQVVKAGGDRCVVVDQ